MKLWISAITILVFSMNSNATVISYDETLQGDLVNTGNFSTNTSLGFFGIGVNTVTGTLTHTFTAGQDANDPFRFNIATDHQLNSVTLFLSHTNNIRELTFTLGDMSPFSALALVDATSTSPILAFTSVLPLTGEDEYYLSFSKLTGTSSPVIIDYTWQFEVSAVPAPAVVWLIGTGLVCLFGVSKYSARSISY